MPRRLHLLYVIVLCLLCGAAAVAAADPDDRPAEREEPPRWSRTWVRRGATVTRRIAAVLDVSGSMRGDPLAYGRQEILKIAGLFPDDGWIRVYRFGDRAEAHPLGWCRLPDAEVLRELADWLAVEGVGSTRLGAGVVAALGNEQSDLSVILVSDGDASDRHDDTLAMIRVAQKARKQGPAPVHIIAVWETEPHEADRELLTAISKEWGGAMVAWSKARVEARRAR